MPLDKKVTFQTRLQSQNRLQVPTHIRWQFKLDQTEILKVTVNAFGMWGTIGSFYAKIQKNGRIAIPKLAMGLIKRDIQTLEGHVMEVSIEPP